MNIRFEIDNFAVAEDRSILHWLFDHYSLQSQWGFVTTCRHQRYGKLSYQTNRVWIPTIEGRALYAQRTMIDAHERLAMLNDWA